VILIDIVIPAYDELPNLRILIPKINSILQPSFQFNLNVILRNDESNEVFDEILNLKANPIRRMDGDSFGDAIRTGVKSISPNSKYTVFMDADGSHDPNTIPRLIYAIENTGSDVVVASRYVKGGKTDNGVVLRMMSRILNLIFGIVLGIKARDISTNFKVYKSDVLRGVKLQCNNFDILEELLIQIRHQSGKIKVEEIPDHFHNRELGESKRRLGPFIVGYILTLIRLRFFKK